MPPSKLCSLSYLLYTLGEVTGFKIGAGFVQIDF